MASLTGIMREKLAEMVPHVEIFVNPQTHQEIVLAEQGIFIAAPGQGKFDVVCIGIDFIKYKDFGQVLHRTNAERQEQRRFRPAQQSPMAKLFPPIPMARSPEACFAIPDGESPLGHYMPTRLYRQSPTSSGTIDLIPLGTTSYMLNPQGPLSFQH